MAEKEFQLIGAKTSDKGERHCFDLNGRSKKLAEEAREMLLSTAIACPTYLRNVKNKVLAVLIES